jgi:hypothetical protein
MNQRTHKPLAVALTVLGAACVVAGIVGAVVATSSHNAPTHHAQAAILRAPGHDENVGAATTTTAAGETSTTSGPTRTTASPQDAAASANGSASEASGSAAQSPATSAQSTASSAQSAPPSSPSNPPAGSVTTTTALAAGQPSWITFSVACSPESGLLADETETVSGYVENYDGPVTVVIPGASLTPGSAPVNQTKQAPAPTGTFTAVFDQFDSDIDLCTNAGTVTAQTNAGLTDTAPNPGWGHSTCSFNPPASRCAP